MTKILIAYFSRSGHTREFAKLIQQHSGGDLLEVRPVRPYPQDYRETTEQAKREQETHARPQIIAEVNHMASYEVVFLGYPNWWGTMPMALFTWLEQYDLSGKTLIPFCTHEGSRFGHSLADIKSKCPKATILDGLALHASLPKELALRNIAQWLGGLRIKA